ncbi:hypothetical protein KR49_11815 [Synechococcus sp. KORDI-49]|nr:hypothetical protein KR49_11815 [Synechococcus sp. KORDI-49]
MMKVKPAVHGKIGEITDCLVLTMGVVRGSISTTIQVMGLN